MKRLIASSGSTDGSPPAIRCSIKHHKPAAGFLHRPIVSSIGSALYNTYKILSDIWSPTQNLNGDSILNSSQFAKEVANMEISDDEVMVSLYDVVFLFTAIPLNKACEYIQNKLNNHNTLRFRTSLTTDDIISLLDFTLSIIYIYKQIHGCAMGSPVSPIVANSCIEVIEEPAVNISTVPPGIWKRYVNDSFVIIKKDAASSFLSLLKQKTMVIPRHLDFQKRKWFCRHWCVSEANPHRPIPGFLFSPWNKTQNQYVLDPSVPSI